MYRDCVRRHCVRRHVVGQASERTRVRNVPVGRGAALKPRPDVEGAAVAFGAGTQVVEALTGLHRSDFDAHSPIGDLERETLSVDSDGYFCR